MLLKIVQVDKQNECLIHFEFSVLLSYKSLPMPNLEACYLSALQIHL